MLRQRDGRLTRDLLRTPGGFGLGLLERCLFFAAAASPRMPGTL